MSTRCGPCQGTGFRNLDQSNGATDGMDTDQIQAWAEANQPNDIAPCTCCGDGDDWYGEPGYHYSSNDLPGRDGPYAYNGGLCECH